MKPSGGNLFSELAMALRRTMSPGRSGTHNKQPTNHCVVNPPQSEPSDITEDSVPVLSNQSHPKSMTSTSVDELAKEMASGLSDSVMEDLRNKPLPKADESSRTSPKRSHSKKRVKRKRSNKATVAPNEARTATDIHPELTLEKLKEPFQRPRHGPTRQSSVTDNGVEALEINTMFDFVPPGRKPVFREGRRSTVHHISLRRSSIAVMANQARQKEKQNMDFFGSKRLEPQSLSAVHYLAISPPRIRITEAHCATSPENEKHSNSTPDLNETDPNLSQIKKDVFESATTAKATQSSRPQSHQPRLKQRRRLLKSVDRSSLESNTSSILHEEQEEDLVEYEDAGCTSSKVEFANSLSNNSTNCEVEEPPEDNSKKVSIKDGTFVKLHSHSSSNTSMSSASRRRSSDETLSSKSLWSCSAGAVSTGTRNTSFDTSVDDMDSRRSSDVTSRRSSEDIFFRSSEGPSQSSTNASTAIPLASTGESHFKESSPMSPISEASTTGCSMQNRRASLTLLVGNNSGGNNLANTAICPAVSSDKGEFHEHSLKPSLVTGGHSRGWKSASPHSPYRSRSLRFVGNASKNFAWHKRPSPIRHSLDLLDGTNVTEDR